MHQLLAIGLLWFSAIGCGLLAGVYFAFSTFIMTALGRIDQTAGIAVMNGINEVIVRSLFMPLFLGTALTSAVLVVMACFRWSQPGAGTMLAGGTVYVIGMFVVTMVFNVPLNDTLAGAHPSGAEAASLWSRYLQDWTFWNHVRTIASLAASVLFTAAIVAK